MKTHAVLLLFACRAALAVSVTTASYDNQRTGANTSETVLTHANVGRIHKTCTYAVDDFVMGQPLVVEQTVGAATHILVAATVNNTLYGWDANRCQAALWSVNFGAPVADTSTEYGLGGHIGCVATPAYSSSTQAVYAVCRTSGGWSLYSRNLADGSEFHAPVAISGTSKRLTFSSNSHKTKVALLVANGNVYTAFTGNDRSPSQGWIFAYNASTVAAVGAWATVNNRDGLAGIWMSGGGLSADGSGNVYASIGNGDWDGTNDVGESVVKLSSTLSFLDWMTPSNWTTLNTTDKDVGTSRVLLTGSRAITGTKDGTIWVLDQASLGHGGASAPGVVQTFNNGNTVAIFNGLAYANGNLYVGNTGLVRYTDSGTTFNTTPAASSGLRSWTVAYSSNGATSGTEIVWTTGGTSSNSGGTVIAGTLRALHGTTLAELWNSDTAAGDALGNWAKFSAPVIANGRVYVATFSNAVVAYGLPQFLRPARRRADLRGSSTSSPSPRPPSIRLPVR